MAADLRPAPAALRPHDDRHLAWEGCVNIRDLGGLCTVDGNRTRRGQLIRADGLGRLTDEGWRDLWEHGVRTVIDLRNDDEIGDDVAGRPDELTTVHVPIDDHRDRAFWQQLRERKLDGSPLYFRPFLDAKPERCAEAITAIARAEPGGVVYHCASGRDRTGLMSTLILSLAGVTSEEIVDDYEHSNVRLVPLLEQLDMLDQLAIIESWLAHHGTTSRQALSELLDGLDAEAELLAAGAEQADLRAVRDRLVG